MGQKVNPHGLRVGVIKDWDSKWYAEDADFSEFLVEDYNIRKFLKEKLYASQGSDTKESPVDHTVSVKDQKFHTFLHLAPWGVSIISIPRAFSSSRILSASA